MRRARGSRSRFAGLLAAAVLGAALVAVPAAEAAAPPGTVLNFCARGGGPGAIAAGPDGRLWYTNLWSASIGRMTTSGAATTFTDTPAGSNSATYTPAGITGGPDGNVWFTNALGRSIGRITPGGSLTRFTAAGVGRPLAITAGPDGNLWFVNEPYTGVENPSIGRVTPAGAFTFFSDPAVNRPSWITTGPDGNLWFTEYGDIPQTGSVGRITPAGVVTMFDHPTIASPRGITAGPDGNLWFTNSVNDSIGRITPAGAVTNFTHPSIDDPVLITAGADGNLWFTMGVPAVGRITTAGVVTSFTHAAISSGYGITSGPDGRIWTVHSANNSITRIDLTAAPAPPPGLQITTPASLPCASRATAYSVPLTATGGTPPYRWKKLTALPKGLRLKAKTGIISGTPTKLSPGDYTVTVQVSDNTKPRPRRVTTKTFTLTVDTCRPNGNPKSSC